MLDYDNLKRDLNEGHVISVAKARWIEDVRKKLEMSMAAPIAVDVFRNH